MACLGMAMVSSTSAAHLSSRCAFSTQFSILSSPSCASVSLRTPAVRAGGSTEILETTVGVPSLNCRGEPSEKSLEVMRKFSEQYARKSDTFFCSDKGVTAVVVKGLAEHKDTLGAPLCPCRHYDDKVAEVQQGFWNCPCVPMRERKECHCMLFLTPDNYFAGKEQKISLQEISELTANV